MNNEGVCEDCGRWSDDVVSFSSFSVEVLEVRDHARCRRCLDSLPSRVVAEMIPTPTAADLEGWISL